MTEEAARRRVLDRIGDIIGQPVPYDSELMSGLEGSLDGSLGVSGWVEMEHRLDAVQPLLGGTATDIDDIGLWVEDVFQSTVARIGDSAYEPDVLRGESPGVRMLVATRVLEGEIDNGGWSAVVYNDILGMVPLAIEGYRLLGLAARADAAATITAEGITEGRVEAFDDAWFKLEPSEPAKASYIRAHPEEFPS